MKILFVCLGNICRSPLAEGILRQKILDQGLDWEVDSAGTGSYHVGENPDPRSIAVARDHDLDISELIGRQVEFSDIEDYDLIFAMDEDNYQYLMNLTHDENQLEKIRLIMDLVKGKEGTSVPDPYWDDDGFEKVYQMLDKATDQLIKKHA